MHSLIIGNILQWHALENDPANTISIVLTETAVEDSKARPGKFVYRISPNQALSDVFDHYLKHHVVAGVPADVLALFYDGHRVQPHANPTQTALYWGMQDGDEIDVLICQGGAEFPDPQEVFNTVQGALEYYRGQMCEKRKLAHEARMAAAFAAVARRKEVVDLVVNEKDAMAGPEQKRRRTEELQPGTSSQPHGLLSVASELQVEIKKERRDANERRRERDSALEQVLNVECSIKCSIK